VNDTSESGIQLVSVH